MTPLMEYQLHARVWGILPVFILFLKTISQGKNHCTYFIDKETEAQTG